MVLRPGGYFPASDRVGEDDPGGIVYPDPEGEQDAAAVQRRHAGSELRRERRQDRSEARRERREVEERRGEERRPQPPAAVGYDGDDDDDWSDQDDGDDEDDGDDDD